MRQDVVCERCMARGSGTPDELRTAGWQPRGDGAGTYDWRCPVCVGQPILLPKKPKRSR